MAQPGGEGSPTHQEEETEPSTSSIAIQRRKKSSQEATSSAALVPDKKKKGKEITESTPKQTPYMTRSVRRKMTLTEESFPKELIGERLG